MPIHDWSKVDAGIFHHFHQAWSIEISNALNGGGLPPRYFALAEQSIGGPIPDVITLQERNSRDPPEESTGAVALADAPPRARLVTSAEIDTYAGRANRIAIRHRLGRVVAIIEIVSPGNKSSHYALHSFVQKARELLRGGINLLVVDLLPPSPREPQGIHKAIWDTICDQPFELPPDKPLTAVAYSAASPVTAYVEPLGVGDPLPGLPIFLDPGMYVPAPLEATYQSTWEKCPEPVRELVAHRLGEA